jgi:small subunit ribosomal protein S6e
MDIVVSDPTSTKAVTKKTDNNAPFINKKIGDEVSLDAIGMDGYVARIAGGSDKQGFPMKKDLTGTSRRKVFVIVDKKKGTKRRISRRGNTVSDEIQQLNVVVVKAGSKKFEEFVTVKEKKPEEEKK